MTEEHDKGQTADIGEVLAALRRQPSRLRGGHSPIYLWLWQHHELLKEQLDLPRRSDWPALAAELGQRGVKDGVGKPPTAERIRKAWWQVCRDKDALAAGKLRRKGKNAAIAAGHPAGQPQPAASTPAVPPPPAFQAVEVEPEPKHQFRFAGGIKKWTDTDPEPE